MLELLLIFILIDVLGLSCHSHLRIQSALPVTILMQALLLSVDFHLCFARKLICFIKIIGCLQVLHCLWITANVSWMLTFYNWSRILLIFILSQLRHTNSWLHHYIRRIHHHFGLLRAKLGAWALAGIVFGDGSAWSSCGPNLFETSSLILMQAIFFLSSMNSLALFDLFTGLLVIHDWYLIAPTSDVWVAACLVVNEVLTWYFSLRCTA